MKKPKKTDDIAVDTIFNAVRDDIISGNLAPDSFINSVELANRFSTSRTPVREALLILNQFGLVTLSARKRPKVASVSVKAIRDLYALRSALHVYISNAIVKSGQTEALLELRKRAEQLIDDEGLSTADYLRMIEDYLAFEAKLCGNDLVIEVLDSLKWRINWFRRLGTMSRDQLRVLAHDRLRVADAYLECDAALAAAMNCSMLRKAADYCEQNFLNRSKAEKPPSV